MKSHVEIEFENITDLSELNSPSSTSPRLSESRSQMISIVSPTYNERENIGLLIKRISKVMSDFEYEIIVVDDNSRDGTEEIVKKLAELYPVRILVRNEKLGLASAIMNGFKHAKGHIVGVIDADLQHPPECLLEFIKAIRKDSCDIVIGSRYVDGGATECWSRKRLLVSKLAVLLATPLARGVQDPMSGFFFLKRRVIEGVSLNPTGYKLGLEILVKGNYVKAKEIPYTFQRRKNGESKLDKREILSYLRLLRDLYMFKLKNSAEK
jgi:dolichol-phosphate mannosyltransferase